MKYLLSEADGPDKDLRPYAEYIHPLIAVAMALPRIYFEAPAGVVEITGPRLTIRITGERRKKESKRVGFLFRPLPTWVFVLAVLAVVLIGLLRKV